AGLDPLAARRQATLDAFAETVFRLAEFAKGRKFYANAVDVYLRCAGSAHAERALRALDKLYENDKALTALLDSGIDVPVETEELRKSPEWIAAEDAKHEDFEEPHEAKSDLYTIRSNSGYLLTHQVLRAMEQMNYFLREMFDYKTRGGGMRRAFIDIHASKQEFMDAHNLGANIGGFFSPSENRIVSYDSRPQGEPLSELWNTLFHEGTHQFVHAISPNLVPAWVNEGTACYFEGTRMLPNGKVEANLIPPNRLESLVQLMDAEAVDVVDVITYFAPGSYSGQFYPYGWGLVYYLRNYEDETGERVYLPFFNEYVATYQSGGNHDVLERWLDYFVRQPKRPGIDSLETWMAQWEAWIRDLHAIHFGGSEQADVLIARARQQVERGKPDHAVETFRWATRKRPGDPAATFELAEVLAAIGQEDAAIYYYRQAGAWADAQPDADAEVPGFDELTAGELSERCLARIGAIYPKLVEGISDARAKFVEEVRALAE
ncbi:MAG TPA: DUF1570 domain-containing protein, partial [Planctomycetota bacterium]|nr:DUF1570 domain-containing protein [Planctomycetota bacterium]